ncbi:hypothetical protein D3C78_748860 [compost metagenome]
MLGIAVGRQPCRQLETGLAAGNEVDHRRTENCPDHLGDDVGQQVLERKPPTHHQPDRHRGVEVASGNMADGESHGQHGQAEGHGHPDQADADGERRGDHRTAAATQHQPERPDQFSTHAFAQGHRHIPVLK